MVPKAVTAVIEQDIQMDRSDQYWSSVFIEIHNSIYAYNFCLFFAYGKSFDSNNINYLAR